MAASSVLGLTILAGVGLGLLTGGGGGGGGSQAGRTVPDLPPGMASAAGLVGTGDEIPSGWGGPSSLVLVVNEDGMEMRVLNGWQVAALARKPGCEFALTPDAVMWVSEYGSERDRFSPGVEF